MKFMHWTVWGIVTIVATSCQQEAGTGNLPFYNAQNGQSAQQYGNGDAYQNQYQQNSQMNNGQFGGGNFNPDDQSQNSFNSNPPEILDVTNINPDDFGQGEPREVYLRYDVKGDGCLWHRGNDGGTSIYQHATVIVEAGRYTVDVTKFGANGGNEVGRVNDAIKDSVGTHFFDRVAVAEVHNQFKNTHDSYDALAFTTTLTNNRIKVNNQPAKHTFTPMIPVNFRFNKKCSDFPDNEVYNTTIKLENNNTSKPASMTVTKTMIGSKKCRVQFELNIPSDNQAASFYNNLAIPRISHAIYDEEKPFIFNSQYALSYYREPEDNCRYNSTLDLDLCSFSGKRDVDAEDTYSCNVGVRSCPGKERAPGC